MKPYVAALLSWPGIAGGVAAVLLAVVIALFAPAVTGLDSAWLVGLLAALPLLLWVAALVLAVRRSQRRDAALVAGASEVDAQAAKAQAADQAARDEEQVVAGRLAEALQTLKQAGGFLYERPWYLLIGPPGAGKTTAIKNSGLKFPLAQGKIDGVGGTRHCDWWIAEEAVLIDTAGRYTTQDSDARVDKAGWERFLQLLRRERADQPLNGVIVAFGVDMLCSLDAQGRQAHGRAVRQRIRELEQSLGQRLPVYMLVSKADLLAGFSEYFEDLDADRRRQVWGMTFEPQASAEGPLAEFSAGFGQLVDRVQGRLLERLQAERGAEQRAAIAGFPAQLASLEEPVKGFLQAAFEGSKLDAAPFLRGVYLTSGTQVGTPIDRLTAALSRTFGLQAQRAAGAPAAGKGRSYFLGRLLADVVFNEARLAARDRGHERRRRLLQLGTAAVAGLAVLGGIAWGWHAASRESARAERAASATAAAEKAAQALAAAGVRLDSAAAEDDLAALLGYLDPARALADAARGPGGGLGISQQAKLEGAAQLGYRHALERALLPRLLARLEGQIREKMQQPAYLYLATRVYLMLARQGPMDAALVQEWMSVDWAQRYPGAVQAPVREKLAAHLASLLEADFKAYEIDGALVESARRVFSRLPMDERVYSRLRSSTIDVPPWRAADALGASGQRLFVLGGGRAIGEATVPGLFTVDGLHRGLLPRLPKAIQEAAAESWVLGPEAAAQLGDARQLENAILRRYAQDYGDEWQKLLDSLSLAPLGSPVQAAEALNLLGAPNSPMRDLLRSVARQLTPSAGPLAKPGPAAGAASAAAAAASAAVAAKVPAGLGRVAETLGVGPGAGNPAAVVAEAVESRFRPLREASGAPLDGVLGAINELYVQVARVASAPPGAGAAPAAVGLDPVQRLQAEAQRAPQPLARWLGSLTQTSSQVRASGARAGLAAAAGQQLAPFCRDVESRFPFNRAPQATDMPMDDFARLFGPGGALEQFFSQNLRDLVDTSQRQWRPVQVGGGPAPISATDVAQFQRAAAIRNAFFPAPLPGQAASALQFELIPLGGSGGTLVADGVSHPIAAGNRPGRPVTLQWPSRGSISVAFEGEPAASTWVLDGPWAALRLASRGRLQPTADANRLRLTLVQGGKALDFELRTRSVVHPFGMAELAEFRCPRLTP